MSDKEKTKEQLIDELQRLRQQVAELQASEAELKQAEEEIKHRSKQLALVNEVGQRIAPILELTELYQTVVEAIQEKFGYQYVAIFSVRDQEVTLEAVASPQAKWIPSAYTQKIGEGMLGWVAQTGETLLANDVAKEPRFLPLEFLDIAAELDVPIRLGGKTIGILTVDSDRPNVFTETDVTTLETIADQVARATENARLFEDTKSRLAQLTALQETTRAVASILELDELLNLITEQATALAQGDGGIINRVHWESKEEEVGAASGSQTHVLGFRSPLEGSLSGWVTLHNQPVISNQLQSDSRVDPRWRTGKAQNAAIAPLTIKDQVIGTLVVMDKPGGFDQAHLDLLIAFANQAATAIENARLYEELRGELAERKRAGQEIRRLSQFLDSVVDNANVWLDVLDEKGNVVIWNKAAEEISGYSREEVMGHDKIWEWLYPDEEYRSEIVAEAATIIEKGGEEEGSETIICRKDGQTRMISWNSRSLLDEKGNPMGSIALGRDITERKQAEAKLERRAVQLQAAAEVSRATTSVLDPEGLLRQVVDLVRERFDLYYVGLFLLDEERQFAVLRAATGEAGREMLEAGHKLEVGGESMIGWCIANAQARIALDVGKEAARFDNPLLPETRSEMALPLLSRGQVIGAVTIQSAQAAAFSEEDITVLQTMADQLASAIENSRLFEEEKRRATQLALVNEVSEKTSSILDLDRLMQEVTRSIQEKFNYYHVSLFLLDEERREVVMQAATGGFEPTATRGYRQSLDEGIIGFVARTGKSWLANDVSKDPYYIEGFTEVVIGSELCVSLKVGDKVIGTLDMQSIRLNDFDQEDIVAIEAIADQVAIAIENARLFEQTQQATFLMGERVKELACLNAIGRKMVETPPVPEFLQWVTESIPLAMRHSEVSLAAVEFEGQVYGAAEAMSLPCQMVQALRIGGEVVGRVYIAYIKEHDFLDEESALLGDIVRRVSGYIESRRLFEETQTRAEELAALNEVGRTIASVLDPDAVLRQIADTTKARFDHYFVSILLVEGNQLVFRDGSTIGDSDIRLERGAVSLDLRGPGLSVEVVRTGQPVLVNDVLSDPRYISTPETAAVHSELAVAIEVKGRIIGVLDVQSDRPDAFDHTDVTLLQSLASQAGVALENARLFEETQAGAEELAVLNELGQALTARLSVEQVLNEAYRQASRLVDTTNFFIALYDPEKDEITFPYMVDSEQEDWSPLKGGEGLTGWVIEAGKPLLLPTGVTGFHREAGGEIQYDEVGKPALSWLGMPLMVGDQVLGVMAVQSYTTPRLYDGHDRDLLTAIASPTAIAIQNARLFEETEAALAEMKNLAEALQVSEERFALAVQGSNDGIWDWDFVNNTLYWSPRFKELLGYADDELDIDFDTFDSLLHPDDREATQAAIEAHFKERGLYDVEQRLRTKLGEYRWFHARGQTLWDEAGNPIRGVGFSTDITERKQAEAERERLLAETENLAGELAVLNELGQALTTRLSVEEVLDEAYRQASRLVDTTNFYIGLYDPEKDEIAFVLDVSKSEIDKQITVMPASQGITGYIIRNRTSVLLGEDASGWEAEMGIETIGQEAPSWLGVPLMVGDRVLGVMVVQSYTTPRLYDEHDRDLLTAIASQVAIALQNARLFEETQAHAEELAALREVNLATLSTLERDQVFEIMLDQLGRVIDYDTAAIKVITPDGRDKMIAGRGSVIHDQVMWDGYDVKDSNIVQEMKETRQPVVVHDTHTDERYERVGGWQTFRSWAGAPLFVRDDFVGYLMVEKASPSFYDEKAVQLLGNFAHAAAIALENARLYEDIRRELAARKQAEAKLERRAVQLQAAAEVSRATTSVLDPSELLHQVVDLVRERFDLYYVGLFLPDEERQFAVLRAGTGEAGRKMLEAGHKLEVGGESMVGWCLANAQARIALDVGEEAVRFSNPLLPETRSELALPLMSRGQVIGVVTIQSAQAAAFSEEDISVLQTMADQLTIAIENARLFAETQQAARRSQALYETSRALSSHLEEEPLMRAILEAVYRTLGCEYANIATVDEQTETISARHIIWRGGFDVLPEWLQKATYPLNHPDITPSVARTGRTEIIGEWDQRFNREIWDKFGHERFLRIFMPIKMRDRVIGVVEVGYDKREKGSVGEEEVQLLAAFMDQAAVALESARLYEELRGELAERKRAEEALRQRTAQLEALQQVGLELTAELDLDALLRSIASRAVQLLGCTSGGLFLYQPQRDVLEWRMSVGPDMDPIGTILNRGEGVAGKVWETGTPLVVDDYQDWEGQADIYRGYPWTAVVGVPVYWGEEFLGVLEVLAEAPRTFSPSDVELLSLFTSPTAIALQNARLFEQIQTRAERERVIREISDQMQRATDMETLMRITAEELNKALGGSRAYVRLGTEAETGVS